jgi:eukaryotic-like serine/threonine-protein kinase
MPDVKVCPTCGTEYEPKERFCPSDGTALRTPGGMSDLVGQVVADRYHVLRKLGEGGMGQVYLAEHVKMGRKSALKVMHPAMGSDPDAIGRFNREASNASRINHPHVAAVYDFGETSDALIYLAMEYVEGQSLTALLEEHGALPVRRASEIIVQAASALAAAHELGIVHRDLKPDNIMIARNRDGSDCVKVVDFGIAKAGTEGNQKVTRTGLVVGTPEYMSPEQLAGDKLDGRSDVYSLGLVAFNLLTGALPFPSESAQESMIMRLTDRPRTLSELRPDIAWDASIQRVMDRVLARAADERYPTAPEFARDLAAAVARMPQSALNADGTLVMGAMTAAVPPTRARGARPSAPTVAATAMLPGVAPTRVSSPASVASPPRSRLPLVVSGGALAVALLAGVGYLATRDRGTTDAPRDTSGAIASAATASAAPTTTVAAIDPPATGTQAYSRPATTAPDAPRAAAPSPSGSSNPVRGGLEDRIERMDEQLKAAASNPTLARALLDDIDSNLPTIRRPGARMLALKARGDLLYALERPAEACAEFARIRKVYARMPQAFRDAVDFYYAEASGPACQ